MLVEGVKIYHYNSNVEDTIFLSNGVKTVKGMYKGIPYVPNSFKPEKPWNLINEADRNKLLLEVPHKDYRKNIGIVKISNRTQDVFRKLNLNESESFESLKLIKQEKSKLYHSALETLSDDISNYLFDDTNIDVLGIKTNSPNVETLTLNEDGKHTGLHVDSWDSHLLMTDLDQIATNRISINLGKKDRYLLFINLTLREIYDRLEIENKKQFNHYGKMELTHAFFSANKNYPVVKVKIRPFEGYIAPTENIIHDGSTEGSNTMDISFNIRGHFNIFRSNLVT